MLLLLFAAQDQVALGGGQGDAEVIPQQPPEIERFGVIVPGQTLVCVVEIVAGGAWGLSAGTATGGAVAGASPDGVAIELSFVAGGAKGIRNPSIQELLILCEAA